jgi:magnesium transporter
MLDERLRLLFETIKRLIRRNAVNNIENILKKIHPADIAHLIKSLNPHDSKFVFNLLKSTNIIAEVLSNLEPSAGAVFLEDFDSEKISAILNEMQSDDAAEMVSMFPEEKARKVLELMEKEESEDVEELLTYEENTAGRIMTQRYLALDEGTLVGKAIEALRKSEEAEMVFYIYVVDERNHLVGVVSLRRLLVVSPDTPLKDFMTGDVVGVRTDLDQEEAAKLVAKYDLLAIPVVDDKNKMMGIITVDDVIDVIREEATEDIYKMAGTSGEELLEHSAFKIASIRLPWLIFTLVGELICGYILKINHQLIQNTIAITLFIPLVMALGGNVGNQSQTIVVRGLATERIDMMGIWGVIARQIRVGLIMGVIAGIVVAFGTLIFDIDQMLSGIVGIAIFVSITFSTAVGAFMPFFFKKLNVDPAVAAGPFITNFNDIMGILFYLGLAVTLMEYLA